MTVVKDITFPAGGGATFTNPVAQPPIVGFTILNFHGEVASLSGSQVVATPMMNLLIQTLDTNGNPIGPPQNVSLTLAQTNAFFALAKTTIYQDVLTQLGLTGSVT
jgi:hypothetical protein